MWHYFIALGSEEYKGSDTSFSTRLRASPYLYSIGNSLLYYRTDATDAASIVVPHDPDSKNRMFFEIHDTALGGHLGHEKT